MGILDILSRIERLDDGAKSITIEDNGCSSCTNRNIYVGTDYTPPQSLGKDGDIYIYKPPISHE